MRRAREPSLENVKGDGASCSVLAVLSVTPITLHAAPPQDVSALLAPIVQKHNVPGMAAAVVLTQGGIAVTGAIVRVTASGLGCPTWPQCFPGSFTPVPHAEVAGIHQAVEFGNRMITFLVVLTAALAVLAVTRARRRREVLIYAWLMPASTKWKR